MPKRIYLPSNRSPRPTEQKFNALQPPATHFAAVSCREYECDPYLMGYSTILPAGGEDIAHMRVWLQTMFPDGLRRTAKETVMDGALIEFRFAPGQPCLPSKTPGGQIVGGAAGHKWVVKPTIFVHDKGEMRRNMRFDDWTDLYNNEGYKVQRARERG